MKTYTLSESEFRTLMLALSLHELQCLQTFEEKDKPEYMEMREKSIQLRRNLVKQYSGGANADPS